VSIWLWQLNSVALIGGDGLPHQRQQERVCWQRWPAYGDARRMDAFYRRSPCSSS
jgi:hypothetical protein